MAYTYGITFAKARICRTKILMYQKCVLHHNVFLLYTACSISFSLCEYCVFMRNHH